MIFCKAVGRLVEKVPEAEFAITNRSSLGRKELPNFCQLLVNVRNLESFLPILDCLVFPLLYTEAGGDTPILASQCWSLPRDSKRCWKREKTQRNNALTALHANPSLLGSLLEN